MAAKHNQSIQTQ